MTMSYALGMLSVGIVAIAIILTISYFVINK